MAGWKVGGVQERRSHVGQVGVQVRRFDPEDKTVRVSKTESKIVAVTRQQLFVVGAVHNEFAQFKYREANREWTVHHYAGTRRLHEDHGGIYYCAALEGGFARGRDEFLTSLAFTRFRRFSHVFPKTTV